jgi:hypothetical protein
MLLFIADAGLPNDYLCLGLPPVSRHRKLVPKTEYDAIMRGHMTDVSYLNLSVEIDPKNPVILVVGWLGDEFIKESTAIGLPVPDLPQNRNVIDGHGSFWFESSETLYKRMTDWISLAARRVFKEKNEKIADLMHWTLVDAEETLAARWYLTETKSKKDRELDFQMQTFYRGRSKKEILAGYKRMISFYLQDPVTF